MDDQKEAVTHIQAPSAQQSVMRIPGSEGHCRIWIPNFGPITNPLYKAVIRTDLESLIWTTDCQTAFKVLKVPLLWVAPEKP